MKTLLARILKTASKILLWTAVSIFALYMFLSFVAMPLAVPWLARTQGTKILKHQVTLGAVRFNPFALRLTMRDLKIMDNDKTRMLGFKKLWVNVSFVKLLKKELRVESLGVDGLNVNVVLLPDNTINLMSLVPQPQTAAPQQPKPGQPASAQVQQPKPVPGQEAAQPQTKTEQQLPDVVVDEIVMENGSVTFTDQAIAPGFTSRLSAMQMKITGVSTQPESQVKLEFNCKLDEKGHISTEALIKPFAQPLDMESTFSMNDYAMRALTPYVGKYTGRAVKEGGKLDVRVDYRIADNKLNAGHKVLIQRFDFGEKVESKDALNLPFGLAVALLEDPQNRINISLPVKGDINDPQFEYFHLVGQVARNFFMKLITAPFKVLFALVPSAPEGTEELGMVKFAAGSAVLGDAEKEKLKFLSDALKERPRLLLEINGTYDTEADWKAIKTQAFEDNFAAMRKESSFEDMRLYVDMYKIQFGVRDYWQLAREYTADGKVDEEKLRAEIRRRIIEEGQPQRTALEALAQQRGQAVYDAILASGFDQQRVKLGAVRSVQMSMGAVPLEFTLTVFEE